MNIIPVGGKGDTSCSHKIVLLDRYNTTIGILMVYFLYVAYVL